MAADPDPVVRFEIAKDATPSPDADLRLVNDPDVRLARASNPHPPTPAAATVQARDPNPDVRLSAAGRSNLPPDAAAGLALDADPEVRAAARDTHSLPRSVLRRSRKLDKSDASNEGHDPVTPGLRHPDDGRALAAEEERAASAHDFSPHTPPSVLRSMRASPWNAPPRPADAADPAAAADAVSMLRSLGHAPVDADIPQVELPSGDAGLAPSRSQQCGSVQTDDGQPCKLPARSCPHPRHAKDRR